MNRLRTHLVTGSAVCFLVSLLTGSARAAAPTADCVVFPDDPSVLNLKRDFGAKGDGVADDTAALQAAIDAAATAGKTVVYLRGTGRGDIFVIDCPSGIELRSPGQSLWARQLNPEGNSDVGLVRNHGGRLWALGVKHEGRGVRWRTDNRGQTEILGLFNYAPSIATNDFRPAFDVADAAFSAAGVREISFGNTYPVKVRVQHGKEARTERGGGWIGWALYRSGQAAPATGGAR